MELLHQQQVTGEGIGSIGGIVLTYEASSTSTTNSAREMAWHQSLASTMKNHKHSGGYNTYRPL
jgi:hypothetical protein